MYYKLLLIKSNDIMIRKITILLIALSVQLTVFASSFSLVLFDSSRTISASYIVAFPGTVTNLDSNTVDITMEVTSSTLPNDWNFAMCTPDGCYPDGVNPVSFDLAVGEDGYTAVHFNVGTTEAVGYLTVRWTNTLDTADYIEVNFEVSYVSTAIRSFEKSSSFIHSFPNPFFAVTTIEYDLEFAEGNIVISNQFGKIIQVTQLKNRSGKVIVDLTGRSSGVYYYSLWNKGILVGTEKLLYYN